MAVRIELKPGDKFVIEKKFGGGLSGSVGYEVGRVTHVGFQPDTDTLPPHKHGITVVSYEVTGSLYAPNIEELPDYVEVKVRKSPETDILCSSKQGPEDMTIARKFPLFNNRGLPTGTQIIHQVDDETIPEPLTQQGISRLVRNLRQSTKSKK